MSFWNTSDGEQVETKTEYEAPGGGGGDIFPDGSSLLAVIDEMKWHSFDDNPERFVNYRLSVLQPEQYKGRKVFLKLHPNGDIANTKTQEKANKKADKSKRFMGVIAANAGWDISKLSAEPSDEDFAANVLNKPMTFRLGLWEMNDKKGNYLQAVADASKGAKVEGELVKKPGSGSTPSADTGSNGGMDMDDEIPF